MVELIWITVQIPMVETNFLQGVISLIVLMTLYLLYRPSVKGYLDMWTLHVTRQV